MIFNKGGIDFWGMALLISHRKQAKTKRNRTHVWAQASEATLPYMPFASLGKVAECWVVF